MSLPLITRAAVRRLGIAALCGGVMVLSCRFTLLSMPGESFRGPTPPLGPREAGLAQALRRDVQRLSVEIGVRDSSEPAALARAADFIEAALKATGLPTTRQPYPYGGQTFANIQAEARGATRPEEILVVGAHYDTCGNPGADDNASGVAALLALGRALPGKGLARTVRLVAFANEEPPFFQGPGMGSLVYARACRGRAENIVAMLSLESLGYYSDAEGSQSYPLPGLRFVYPSTGDFVAIVGNVGSRRLVREVIASFRERCAFPSEGAALPGFIAGVGWSDHWSFWQAGYPAVMLTDTAPFRNPHYHSARDTPDTLDFERLARVTAGVIDVVGDLARDAGPR